MTDPGDRFFLRGDVKGPTLRLYRDRDELKVVARADFQAEFVASGACLPEGPKWTLAQGDQVLGVGGLTLVGWGHWFAWAYLSDLKPRQWAFAAAMAAAVIDYARRAFWVARIDAEAAGHPGAARVLRRIGFEGVGDDFTILGND